VGVEGESRKEEAAGERERGGAKLSGVKFSDRCTHLLHDGLERVRANVNPARDGMVR